MWPVYRLQLMAMFKAQHGDVGALWLMSASYAHAPRKGPVCAPVAAANSTTVAVERAGLFTVSPAAFIAPTGPNGLHQIPKLPEGFYVSYCRNNEGQAPECKIETCPCCGGLGVAARCGSCNGTGAIYMRTLREAQLAHASQWEKCEVCKGRGFFPISGNLFDRMGFGKPPQRARA